MANQVATDLLQAILDRLTSIEGILRQAQAPKGGDVAQDADLDAQYGDPELKFTPRDWTGDTYKGRRFSECPSPLLDLVASSLDYFAAKAEKEGKVTASGKPVAIYERKDAARARGWAKRHRERGFTPQPAQEVNSGWDESGEQKGW